MALILAFLFQIKPIDTQNYYAKNKKWNEIGHHKNVYDFPKIRTEFIALS